MSSEKGGHRYEILEDGTIRFLDTHNRYVLTLDGRREEAVVRFESPVSGAHTDKFNLSVSGKRQKFAIAIAARVPDEQKRTHYDNALAELEVVSSLATERRAVVELSQAPAKKSLAFPAEVLWPTAVVLSALLSSIMTELCRYVVADQHVLVSVALWVVAAHAIAAFVIFPLLVIVAPDSACGKTTLLRVIQAFVPRPMAGTNMTGPVLFRAIEKHQVTLMIDEADTFLDKDSDLRGIINSGHTRDTAFVHRNVRVGDDHELQEFSTWAPKVIARIGRFTQTIESRAIVASLRRRTADETSTDLDLDAKQQLEGLRLRDQAARWVADNIEALKQARPVPLTDVESRFRDNWRPLLAIADAAGPEWAERARSAARALADSLEKPTSPGMLLLQDLQAICQERKITQIATEHLLDALNDMDDRPWPEWRRGQPMISGSLAKLLAPYGIKPTKWRGTNGAHFRGYVIDAKAKDAFARYIPAVAAPRPPQAPPLKKTPTDAPVDFVPSVSQQFWPDPTSPAALAAVEAVIPGGAPPCFAGRALRSTSPSFKDGDEDGVGYSMEVETCLLCPFEVFCMDASLRKSR